MPSDTPFISSKNNRALLFQLILGIEVVIPIWANQYIEPLQAVYQTEAAYKAAIRTFNKEIYRIKHMILNLSKVLFVSTEILKKFNVSLNTFLNINTPEDMQEVKRELPHSPK